MDTGDCSNLADTCLRFSNVECRIRKVLLGKKDTREKLGGVRRTLGVVSLELRLGIIGANINKDSRNRTHTNGFEDRCSTTKLYP